MGLLCRPYDRQRVDWAGDRDWRSAGVAMAADHLRHAFRATGTFRLWDSGWGILFLGAGICVFPSLQSDRGRIRIRCLANDTGGLRKWRYRTGDRPVPENTLDTASAYRNCISGGLRVMGWLFSLHLSAGACTDAKGGDLCLRQSDCGCFPWLDHSPRAGRFVHAVRDGDYYRVSGAGKYVKAERAANGALAGWRSAVLPQDRERGGRLKTIGKLSNFWVIEGKFVCQI